MHIRPAARYGGTARLISTGTTQLSDHQRGRIYRTGWDNLIKSLLFLRKQSNASAAGQEIVILIILICLVWFLCLCGLRCLDQLLAIILSNCQCNITCHTFQSIREHTTEPQLVNFPFIFCEMHILWGSKAPIWNIPRASINILRPFSWSSPNFWPCSANVAPEMLVTRLLSHISPTFFTQEKSTK